MWREWLKNAFQRLTGTNDALFTNIWGKNRLLFDNKQGIGDAVDFFSARLIASTLRQKKRLLIVFPDFQPHRPAFLFATALLRYFLDTRQLNASTPHLVLYFGSHIGIREQLRRTSIQSLGLDLAQVFSQQDIRRGATGISGRETRQELDIYVITIYSPADPIGILQKHRPCWIAIDCSNASSITWLQPLMKKAVQSEIPVVAWGQNPFSECVDDFTLFGHTFIWPPNSPHLLAGELKGLLYPESFIHLKPLILCGKPVDSFSISLQKAYQILSSISQQVDKNDRFMRDAVSIHWKYFRTLESLPVPFDFYEAESEQFWGLQSFRKLASVSDYFRKACMQHNSSLYHILEKIAHLLQKAQNDLEQLGCGLWEALVNLCIEDVGKNKTRLLVFPSDKRKQLFLFALLARHNTVESDLKKMGIYVTSLTKLARWMYSKNKKYEEHADDDREMPPLGRIWHPIFVGLPYSFQIPLLLYSFLHPKTSILLYPHQYPSFMRRQSELSDRLNGYVRKNFETLRDISCIKSTIDFNSIIQERIYVEEPIELNVHSSEKTKKASTEMLWQPVESVIEIARIFESDEECEDKDLIINDQIDTREDETEEIWCPDAVKILFNQGWYGYFSPDDKLHVITDYRFELRYIRALKPNDRVMFIHGQKRQNLYDLIISRVHQHPSIEFFLALIKRWQKELQVAYGMWLKNLGEWDEILKYGSHDINELLKRMQALGSKLTSSTALINWIKGLVLCPLDPEDLRRIGVVLNIEFIKKYYKQIDRAAKRLRGLHRGLSIRLNRWLHDQMAGAMRGNVNDVIDAELGLTFEDIRNSLLVLDVIKIENVVGPFLRNHLGFVKKEE